MQMRYGPNRVGPFGSAAVTGGRHRSCALKEGLTDGVDSLIYLLAPIISVVPAIHGLRRDPDGTGGVIRFGLEPHCN